MVGPMVHARGPSFRSLDLAHLHGAHDDDRTRMTILLTHC